MGLNRDREAVACYSSSVRVATGKVVDGKVVVEGEPLDEGTVVTVIAPEDEQTFELTPEEQVALRAALAEADRGEVVDADELLDELSR
jgi:hypothetical protein